MENQRNILFLVWIMLSLFVWQSWVSDSTMKPEPQVAAFQNEYTEQTSGEQVIIKTDVLALSIDLKGGDIEQAELLQYAQVLHEPAPFRLLRRSPNFVYIAQSGLVGRDGPDRAKQDNSRPIYSVTQKEFTLPDGKDEIRVPLHYVDSSNQVEYIKTFILKRSQYFVEVEYSVNNKGSKPVQLEMYGQLTQSTKLPEKVDNGPLGFGVQAYRGAAYSSDDSKYQKYSFSDIADTELNITTRSGWIAMLQQYFVTAWVPPQNNVNTFYSRSLSKAQTGELAQLGFRTEPFTVQPAEQEEVSAGIWIGPTLQNEMADAANNLNLTVDYGWLWFLSQPLFYLLKFFYGLVGNWGVAIIMVTFTVRGLMYPLTKAQYTSTAKMKLLQPKLQEMRERIGDDRQRMSKEMMELYKNEKVNPLGGCFIVLLQMPIFLSLYYMLMASVELRHAAFFGWLTDLSAPDQYYILPLLMGLTMFLIQKMSPTPVTDPLQKKMMNFMPIIFTAVFLWFPSGLVLYYTVSNLFTIVQQDLIYRGLEKKGLHQRHKKK